MRKCPKCGVNVLDDDARFCIKCGTSLNEPLKAALSAAPTAPAPKKKTLGFLSKKSGVVNVQPGQKIDIMKIRPNLTSVKIAVSWNCPAEIDVDLAAFIFGERDEIQSEEDLVFYNNPVHISGCVEHSSVSDNEEQIQINLSKLPANIKSFTLTLSINDEDEQGYTFASIDNIKVNVLDSNGIFLKCNLPSNFEDETASLIAELIRQEQGWSFEARLEGTVGGLAELCELWGLEVQ